MSCENEIRELLNGRVAALERRDAHAANLALDRDLVAFEVAGPLQIRAAQATDDALTQTWLDSFGVGPTVTMEELIIHANETIAFCHSLNRLQGKRVDGQSIDLKMRIDAGLAQTPWPMEDRSQSHVIPARDVKLVR